MKLFILSVSDQIYSTNRILEEAKLRNIETRVINHTQCSVLLAHGKPQIMFAKENILDVPDAIIPRIGNSVSRHGAAVVKEFEMNGVFSTAKSLGILRAQNKVRTLQIMNRKKIPVPHTVFSVDPRNIEEQIALLGGPPVIVKLQEGTQGLGVVLAETMKSAKSVIDTFYSLKTSILLQEFIEESNGEDIRAFVVGGRIVAAMKRRGAAGEFRSNIHRGGDGISIKLTSRERNIAIKATRHLSLPVAGVDMIRSKRGPLLIEVNASPGLQGIEAYTGINIAAEIIKYVEKNAEKKVR